jgi:hypothetical protein
MYYGFRGKYDLPKNIFSTDYKTLLRFMVPQTQVSLSSHDVLAKLAARERGRRLVLFGSPYPERQPPPPPPTWAAWAECTKNRQTHRKRRVLAQTGKPPAPKESALRIAKKADNVGLSKL